MHTYDPGKLRLKKLYAVVPLKTAGMEIVEVTAPCRCLLSARHEPRPYVIDLLTAAVAEHINVNPRSRWIRQRAHGLLQRECASIVASRTPVAVPGASRARLRLKAQIQGRSSWQMVNARACARCDFERQWHALILRRATRKGGACPLPTRTTRSAHRERGCATGVAGSSCGDSRIGQRARDWCVSLRAYYTTLALIEVECEWDFTRQC